MKKIFLALSLIAMVLFSVPLDSFAQEPAKLEVTGEEGLYQFQSVDLAISPVNNTAGGAYKPGETVEFEGSVHNKNGYPIVNGYIFARVGEVHDAYMSLGYKTVDEFFVRENISIDANTKLPIRFSWKIPENISGGQYSVDYFFSVDKRFNLGGLSFTNEIKAGSTEINIISEQSKIFELNKNFTSINNIKYPHIGGWPNFSSGQSVAVKQPIINFSDKDISVDVTYGLYSWDSIREEDFISTKKETVSVKANSTVDLVYEISKVELPVSYVRITAENAGVKSIVNIRFASDISDTRINYSAINKFPLNKGDSFKSFISYHTVSGTTMGGQLVINLKDQNGKVLYSAIGNKDIYSSVEASVVAFEAKKEISYLKLEAEIKDSVGNVLDSYTTEYSCDTLNSEACLVLKAKGYDFNIIIYSILAVLLILVVIYFLIRSKKNKDQKPLLFLSTLLLFFSLVFLFTNVLERTQLVFAQGTYLSSTLKTDISSGPQKQAGWDDRVFGDILVSRNLSAWIHVGRSTSTLTTLNIGDKFYVKSRSECTFNISGSVWDTPYCDYVLNITESTGNPGRIFMTSPSFNPSLVFDSSKISCSEITAPTGSGILAVNQNLLKGQSITTADGNYYLTLQTAGNAVLYSRGGTALWWSGTNSLPTANHLVLQADGNLVIYNSSNQALWNLGTQGNGTPSGLHVQSDGNLVIYKSGGGVIWASFNVPKGVVSKTWECTAIGSGSSNLSLNVPSANSNMYACAVWGDSNTIRTTLNNSANNNPSCVGQNADARIGFGTYNNYNVNDSSISLPAKSFSWIVEVNSPLEVCTTMKISDIDNNQYNIVNIGTQTWMAENLKTTKYNDGTVIPVSAGLDQNKNLAWYNNVLSNKDIYGGLYNYAAVNTNNLCPTGWHVPNEAEWKTLFTNLNGVAQNHVTGLQYNDIGKKLKTVARGGTNDYGFSAKGGGKYDVDSGSWIFSSIGTSFWAIADSLYDGVNYKSINDADWSDSIWLQYPRNQKAKFSIRCVKDVPCSDTSCYTPQAKFKLTTTTQNFNNMDSACKASHGQNWEFATIDDIDENAILTGNNGQPLFSGFIIKNTPSNIAPFTGQVAPIETTWPESGKMVLVTTNSSDSLNYLYSDLPRSTTWIPGLCRNTSITPSAIPCPITNNLIASCYGTPNPVATGTPVLWQATASGGTGSYTYSWSGTDGLTGSGSFVSKIYNNINPNPKQATVLVTSGSATTSATCFGSSTNGGGSCTSNCGITATTTPITTPPPITPPSGETLSCSFTQKPSSPIQVNTETTWAITTIPADATVSWYVRNLPNGNYTEITGKTGKTLKYFFTTIGAREIKAIIIKDGSLPAECIANSTSDGNTFSIVQTGGNIQEQ